MSIVVKHIVYIIQGVPRIKQWDQYSTHTYIIMSSYCSWWGHFNREYPSSTRAFIMAYWPCHWAADGYWLYQLHFGPLSCVRFNMHVWGFICCKSTCISVKNASSPVHFQYINWVLGPTMTHFMRWTIKSIMYL